MKNPNSNRFILLISILTFVFINSIYPQSGWILKSTGSNINSVFLIDPSKGWMVGDSGLVFITNDGGMNWSGSGSITSNNLYSVFFINASTGWAAGSNGTIIKSTNGGDNWNLLTTGVTYGLNSIQFLTIDTGYAIGEKELRTTNGGLTWTDYGLSLTSNSAYFTSVNTGYYLSPSHIFKTIDGGFTWSTFTLFTSNAIFFINENTGWCTSGGTNRYTTNAGVNWISQTMGGGFSTQYGVHFSDVSSGWSVGSIETSGGFSSIRRTTNSGTNWTGQSSGTTSTLRSVKATTSTNGITVGDKGTVLLTTNGGTNWSSALNVFTYPSDPNYNLYSVYFANNNTGWCGGQLGLVSKTTNGGDKWTSVLTTSYNSILSVHFTDTDTGWISGEGGMVQMTKNGGANWTSQSLGISNKINDIYIGKFSLTGFFGLYKIGWCVGSSGIIYKTTDAGATWTGQLSMTSADLYSVVPFSENVALACGDSGKILKTTDGGLSWVTKTSGLITGSLRAMAFADENYGICVGDSAAVFYTTNKGDTWIADLTGPRSLTNKNLTDVSARMGVYAVYTAVGEDGVVLKSEDEGSTWIKQSTGIKTKLSGISSPSDDVCIITGTKGTILKTSDGGAFPVDLISLTYTIIGNDVKLNWETAGEMNNSGFDIERSDYGNSGFGTWIKKGSLKGAGTISSPQQYSFQDNGLNSGKYKYRLKQIDYNGNFEYFNLSSDIVIESPSEFTLFQNYPNPFNPVTNISFNLNKSGFVSLKVYDVTGKEVKTLISENREAGSYKTQFDGSGLSSGVYFYTLVSGNYRDTKKLLLLK